MAKIDLSPSHAVFVLERALEERKISTGDVRRYMSRLGDEIRSLEERLASLKESVVASVSKRSSRRSVARPKATRKPRRKTVSPERKASQELQGRYIAAIRTVPASQRPKFKKIAKVEGREKAIAAIRNRSSRA